MSFDASALPRQLLYWTIHCSINALPSFLIACIHLHLWGQPWALAAMLSAVATFIAGYSVVTSLRGPLSDPSHLLSRSIRLGAKIRMIVSAVSIPLAVSDYILLLPDFWCGFLAVNLVNGILGRMGVSNGLISTNGSVASGSEVPQASFSAVYASTMTEGLLLSFGLLMISFFALLVLQIQERRKAYRTAGSER